MKDKTYVIIFNVHHSDADQRKIGWFDGMEILPDDKYECTEDHIMSIVNKNIPSPGNCQILEMTDFIDLFNNDDINQTNCFIAHVTMVGG